MGKDRVTLADIMVLGRDSTTVPSSSITSSFAKIIFLLVGLTNCQSMFSAIVSISASPSVMRIVFS